MIRIVRGPAPEGLDPTSTTDTYRAGAVVRALHAMQHKKCCYCEMWIPVAGLGKHVEHFRPRSTFGDLTNSWSNLLLACPQCNGSKSDQFPAVVDHEHEHVVHPQLIDPADPDDDPEDHLLFKVDDTADDIGLVAARNGSEKGAATLDVTQIYRSYYVQARRDHLRSLKQRWDDFLDDYLRARETRELGDLEDRYQRLMDLGAPSRQFAAMSREFLRLKRVEERYERLVADVAAGTAT